MNNEKQICPVCNGRGWVNLSFYEPEVLDTTVGDQRVKCSACDGKGII